MYQDANEKKKSLEKEIEMESQELSLKKVLFHAGEADLSEVMNTEFRLLQSRLSLLKAELDSYLGIILVAKATALNVNIMGKL